MAKVGILSMQRIINYGSFLQAYGLKAMLEEMGHEVQFVDYRIGAPLVSSGGRKQKAGLSGKINKGLEVLSYDAPMKQKIQFILYKKRFAEKYHNILGLTKEPNYTPKLDVLVIGSDEVFNCVQANPNVGYSPELFGKDNNAGKVISYAASFGNTTLEKLEQYGKAEEIGGLLDGFHAISVRDENSAQIVRRLTGKEVSIHLDPVLIYDYIGKCTRIPLIAPKEGYLLLYAYSGRILPEESDWIAAYAKKNKLKIYALGGVHKCADKFITCSPFEVLAYFQNAHEVITDTFHGTIFSIITRKKFVTLIRKSVGNSYGNEEKIADLLRRLYLQDRGVMDISQAEDVLEKEIDYTGAERVLQSEYARSVQYFKGEIG